MSEFDGLVPGQTQDGLLIFRFHKTSKLKFSKAKADNNIYPTGNSNDDVLLDLLVVILRTKLFD